MGPPKPSRYSEGTVDTYLLAGGCGTLGQSVSSA